MNPFILSPYYDKSLFCDREKELDILFNSLTNGANITLLAPRRFGKTGLIYRLFDEFSLNNCGFDTFYVDIYATQTIDEFLKVFSQSILKLFQKKTSLFKKTMNALTGLKPTLSFDDLSGVPQISLTFNSEEEKHHTLQSIFSLLEHHNKKVIVAFDEFQQIREYKGVNMEALLRTYIQPLQNVQFIFCGSKKHLMVDIFSNAKNPFYASTQFLTLDRIAEDKYASFIKNQFEKQGKTIDVDAIDFILKFTRRHTFYTQSLCNYIFAHSGKFIKLDFSKSCAANLLEINEGTYLQYRSLLTVQQWNYLKAIAKEDVILQPMATSFLQKYSIGTPANSKRILQSLLEKELLFANVTYSNVEYYVYDTFFSRWLESL